MQEAEGGRDERLAVTERFPQEVGAESIMRIITNIALYGATLGSVWLMSASQAAAVAVDLVTFDAPSFAQGPSTYVAAGAPQTIVTTPATFSGGVILGFATFFPAISFASAPNVYGTADFGVGLSNTLNININPGYSTNQVSFALFNGETFAQTYVATAYDGTTQVATQTLSSLAANFNSGYGIVDLQAPNITSVVVGAFGRPAVFDFLIDSVAFNQSAQQAINSAPPPATPPPAVFIPPPPVVITKDDGTEVELELNYGDSIDGKGTLNSLNNIPSVPEPATWAMLLIGSGVVGLASRRGRARRTQVLA